MTPGQINEIINCDLWEDAYARQRENPVVFSGKKLAEGLETMLCVCPKCGQIGKLRSHEDMLDCTCGLSASFTKYGFLEGEGLPFDNTADWDTWQNEILQEKTDAADDGEPIFSDGEVKMDLLLENHRQKTLGFGMLNVYNDRLVFSGYDFPFRDISGMGMHGPLGLSFTAAGKHYELTSKKLCCLRKYMTVYDYVRPRAELVKEAVENV
jgi:hypothetical protein